MLVPEWPVLCRVARYCGSTCCGWLLRRMESGYRVLLYLDATANGGAVDFGDREIAYPLRRHYKCRRTDFVAAHLLTPDGIRLLGCAVAGSYAKRTTLGVARVVHSRKILRLYALWPGFVTPDGIRLPGTTVAGSYGKRGQWTSAIGRSPTRYDGITNAAELTLLQLICWRRTESGCRVMPCL